MDVRPCRNCKKLFNYLAGPPICPACQDKLEKKFKVVREYIRENPRASMQEVADDNEVTIKQLKNWVREERLKFSDDSPVGVECLNCGTMIKYGKYCEACKTKMMNRLSNLTEPQEEKPEKKIKQDSKNRMYFLET